MPRSKTKITIETIQELCEKHNWTSLEETYINANTSMEWQCNVCAFTWKSNYNNTRKSKGCSRCLKGSHKYSHDYVVIETKKKGCQPLETYKRSDIPMRWGCLTCDYTWKTSFSNIHRKDGKKCPKCNGNRSSYSFEEVKQIAMEKKIECLSSSYEHCNIPMEWKCLKCNREWVTIFRSINQNIGCLKCNHKEKMSLDMNVIHARIDHRPFQCISKEYTNSQTNLQWKCDICLLEWEATPNHIHHSNSGCPNCSSYKSERLCRQYFQSFLGYNFPTKRLKCMEKLEFDGYCEEFHLAFEYQGKQHFERVPHFHKEDDALEKQQERDIKKKELCKQNGITLIEIPYAYNSRNPDELENYILKQLLITKFLAVV